MLKALAVAFSMYSALPVPQFEWKEKEMRRAILFFPLVGAVCGLVLTGFLWIGRRAGFHELTGALAALLVPCLVSGGIHVDGFMDTSDALSSYRTKEERLAILKDPHIGAFAVIRLAVLGGIGLAAAVNLDMAAFHVLAAGYYLSRALSALAAVTFPNARGNGSLMEFTKAVDRRRAVLVLFAQIAAGIAVMVWISPLRGLFAAAAAVAAFLYYKVMSVRNFGGITGDLAGWFVCVSETAMITALAIVSVLS